MKREKAVRSLKWIYKVVRSLIFTAIIVLVAIFTLLYAALAVPPVQNYIRERLETELTAFLGSRLSIGNLSIRPVNEVIIENAVVRDPGGKDCLKIERLGAGINLWRLLFSGDIEITYVELISLQADIYQEFQDGPLNIDFLIQAFSPKDKNNPPTAFDLKIHNIVVRRSNVEFNRLWKEEKPGHLFDSNHISLSGLSADITIPRLSNDLSEIDLRRLSFSEKSGLQLRELGGYFIIRPDYIGINDFILRLPESVIKIKDFTVDPSLFSDSQESVSPVTLKIYDSHITPSNLSAFLTDLSSIQTSLPLEMMVTGNRNFISIDNLRVGTSDFISAEAKAYVRDFLSLESMEADIKTLKLQATREGISEILSAASEIQSGKVANEIIAGIGNLEVTASGRYSAPSKFFNIESDITTGAGALSLNAEGTMADKNIGGKASITIPAFSFGEIKPELPLDEIKNANFDIRGSLNLKDLRLSDGTVDFSLNSLTLFNRTVFDISGSLEKEKDLYSLALAIEDINLNGRIEASVNLDGTDTSWDIVAKIDDYDTYSSFLEDSYEKGYGFKGEIDAHAIGNSIDNITGRLELTDFSVTKWDGRTLGMNSLLLTIEEDEEGYKTTDLVSGIADLHLEGPYVISRIPGLLRRTLYEVCPAMFDNYYGDTECGRAQFRLDIKDAEPLIEFFKIPVFPLTEMQITGSFDSERGSLRVGSEIPFIQQGANNLITGTYVDIDILGEKGESRINAGTVYPTKKGLLKLDLDILGKYGDFDVMLEFNRGRKVSFYGELLLSLILKRDEITDKPVISAHWAPSSLYLNDAEWKMEESEITYSEGCLAIRDFCLRHDNQFVSIGGINDSETGGMISVDLSDINMNYVFETLNIDHVTFGGTVSGKVMAKDIFSKNPDIRTHDLYATEFSYNGGLLGNADLMASLDLPAKKIAIGAVITENGHIAAEADGGVWFGRDSLAFNFKADRVNVEFMQPFMSAFSSSIRGRASGDALLYGTFSDINMTGTLFADNVDILIDYINARYTGSDTVFMRPGVIEIPGFKVSDKFGHTAIVKGTLSHDYFHNPSFRFYVTEMDNLLVYDTNQRLNPLWYGTIFASGNGEITGRPGLVRIAADVETGPGSDFTFVLSDQQEAVKSNFLTFSDRRKEAAIAALPKDTVPEFLRKFRQTKVEQHNDASDIFVMDFRVSVTDDVRFNLVMDPIQGDKIVAYGDGAMTLTYNSLTDDLRLYGKYVLDKGTYNFSLQDIILKEFTIKPGSSIAFTGDPYTGILDMTAAYRVNTSLTELDRSFANDRELNRTSVPVEALLKVTGVLTAPNIDFDIELPTVTEETAQKVRSIISTEDMMSRQVLFLVALNKFYPPEYMSTSNSGGEWASIASSTISSQIQNMIGQITDKFTLAPSIRSDKGDFSDIEVDLALSSQLFDNRLLINGNLGYRDPSNSSTTFVGDFDIEYLLNRKGTWRVKAYNHFNDQNYYLKSALTTQGLGIIWRKEFGTPRKKDEVENTEPADSITP